MDEALEEVGFAKYGHLSDEDLLDIIEVALSDIMARFPFNDPLSGPR